MFGNFNSQLKWQPLKAPPISTAPPPPIYSKVVGRESEPVKELHQRNALGPMRVTPSGMMIEPVRLTQFLKALSPIPVRLSGRTTRTNEFFSSNARS